MDWITGIQKAIDYIEENLTEDIDYEKAAACGFSSVYHFQRVFSLLCGFTLGEYIRNRRLSLAGAELAAGDAKVLDVALKYGYENPDSFARAFFKFHGILPSAAKQGGKNLRSFSRLVLKISLEGGKDMHYRMEEKPEMILTGYKAHFTGAPYGKERERQEEQLFVSTRGKQWLLRGAANYSGEYCVITNVTDEGYDFYYCQMLDEWTRKNLYNREVTGVNFMEDLQLETLVIPKTTYGVFASGSGKKAVGDYFRLLDSRVQVLTEWMPEMGFELAEAPELAVYRWGPGEDRSIEVWLPVKKI